MKISFWRPWWSSARAGKQSGPSLRKTPLPLRLQLEQLEDRTLMSGTPQMVLDINPGSPSSSPSQMVAIGSMIYFSANDGAHGNELWKSDGTAAGTVMVADVNPGSAGSNPANLTNVNGTLFFTANDGSHGTELWKSDGTASGTVMVADINPGSAGSNPSSLTKVNGTLFFAANDGTHGDRLWKSDGTAAGTVMVSAVGPSSPGDITNVNGTLFFAANDATHGWELWKSAGTAAGTVLVKDIDPGSASSDPSGLTNVNGTLFFVANDGTHGWELWKSDGSAAGTVLVKDIEPGSAGSSPSQLTNVNGTLFFGANDGTHGLHLWKSDGTAAGTVMVEDINPIGSSYPSDLTNVNGTLFFTAYDPSIGTELWKSDGTTAGTTLVKDVYPGGIRGVFYDNYGDPVYTYAVNSSNPINLTNVNGTLFFTANDGTGDDLWQSDGTFAGTVFVGNINPSGNNAYPSNFTNANGTLFFSADDGTHGNELWVVPKGPSLAVSGFPTASTAGAVGSLTVTAHNSDGSTDTGYVGTVQFSSTDSRATILDPATGNRVPLANFQYQFTAADGGTRPFTVYLETAGTQSITATDTQTPTDNGSEQGILVQPAATSRFVVTGYPSWPITANVAEAFTVTAYDQYGNVATGYTGTVHFTSSDPQAGLPADAALTNGVGQFSATLKTAGNQSITATDAGNSAVTGSETGIEVIPAISINGPSGGACNQTLTYTLGVSGDPAGALFTFMIQWGDGSAAQALTGPSGTMISHTYSATGSYSLSVSATDPNGFAGGKTATVNILGVSVAIQADPATPGKEMLIIYGTPSSDSLVLAGTGSGVSLTFDGTALGTIVPTNGSPFALVLAFGEGGNDTLDARNLALSSVLEGGSGNDTLYGGSAPNLLVGGTGADTLFAGSAGDILIGGTTSYDGNLTALAYLMAEWSSADSYAVRVNKLTNGGGLNGPYALNSTTVFDDNTTDALYGGSGQDWYFAHVKGKNTDKVYNRASGEVLTGI
jgi:ELWxxDGT repeat protein